MKRNSAFLFAAAMIFLIGGILSAQRRLVQTSVYITGKVVQRSNPVRSIWVLLYDGNRLQGRSLTGDDGRYYIGGLENKSYTIIVKRQPTASNLFTQQVTLPKNRQFDITVP
ncbi:MAG TPA: hypothetical protein VF146_14805 [Bryobacteraceae bacterium]